MAKIAAQRELTEQARELQILRREDVELVAMLQSTLHATQTSLGMARGQVERYQLCEAKRAEARSDTASRISLAKQAKEADAARVLVPELQEKLRLLEEETLRRGAVPPPPTGVELIEQRTSESDSAQFTPRAYEYMRRIVEEGNLSIQGAHTVIALVLSMFLEGGPTDAMLPCSNTIKKAFKDLGLMDNDAEKRANELSKEYWAMGCDGGNKGRAIEMMAYSIWDAAKKKPVCRPLAAGDLHGDQTAKNSEATMLRFFERLGLLPATAVSNTSDGADAATQASANFLESLAELSGLREQRSSIENCCIHGKALEENAGAAIYDHTAPPQRVHCTYFN